MQFKLIKIFDFLFPRCFPFNNSFSGRKSNVRNTSIPEPFQSKKQTNFDTLNKLKEIGFSNAYICMAKTPNSLSDKDELIGRPEGFTITVKEVRVSAGVNFVVVLTGKVMTMPGLPKTPAANRMNIDKDGTIEGLF